MAETFILPQLTDRESAINRISRFLAQLPAGRAWRVTVEPHARERSDAQRNYLNGVCYKRLGDALGYDLEDMRDTMLGAYFGWKDKKVPPTPRNPDGIESVPVRSTTTNEDGKREVLGTLAFSEYVAFIQRKAAEYGVYIPDPEEV